MQKRDLLFIETEIRPALAEERNLRALAKGVFRGGPDRRAHVLALLQACREPEDARLRSQELQAHIHVIAGDEMKAEALVSDLARSPEGQAAATRAINSALLNGDLDLGARLVEAALTAAPNALDFRRLEVTLSARRDSSVDGYEALKALGREHPDSADIALKVMRAAGRLHRWEEAREELARFAETLPNSGGVRHGLHVAAVYAAAQDAEAPDPAVPGAVDVRYINLDEDTVRRGRVEAAFAATGIQPIRSPGVRGGYLPMLVRDRVSRPSKSYHAATLGVFLSHVRVWEQVADSERTGLVIEDDAFPMLRLRSALERLAGEVREFCFVNFRIGRLVRPLCPTPQGFEMLPAARLAEVMTRDTAPPGGDGYILTPAGARKLLAYVAEDGMLGHVDVQMLSYGLGRSDYGDPAAGGRQLARLGAYWDRHVGERRLDAQVLYPALIEAIDFGHSVRRAA